MTTADAALRAHLREAGGAVSFAEFMRWALYDPAHGYYARRVRTVGATGDFSTASTLHPALSAAVARWAARHRPGGRWNFIELGGGSGELAAGVLDALGWWMRRGLRYHFVEVSAGLRATQGERLRRWAGRVSWHATLAEALREAGGAALIFSNEFVDAFPCARWLLAEDGWREVRVAWPEASERPMEVLGDLVPAAEMRLASVVDEDLPPGQRTEIFLSYRRWQQEQLAAWRLGRMLTIDYGDECPALYHRRPGGTLRAYCRQMRFDGDEIYARLGQQDLTADVNFTDLRHWGDELDLATTSFGTQADFLRRWLPPAVTVGAVRDARLSALLDPDGAGGAFKVLEQTPPPG